MIDKINCSRLDFDTDVTGVLSGIWDIKTNRYEVLGPFLNDCLEFGYKHLIVRATLDSLDLIRELEKVGFVLSDVCVNYKYDIESSGLPEIPKYLDYKIRLATEDDIEAMQKLVIGTFKYDRYHTDPLYTKEMADKVYVKWVENAVLSRYDTLAFVTDVEGDIGGFSTLRILPYTAIIGITAVSDKYRHRDMAKNLFRRHIIKANECNLFDVSVVTQVNNIPAIKLHESCGFKLSESYVTMVYTNG